MRLTLLTLLVATSLLSAADAPMEIIAGTGQSGYSGDGGPARQAQLNQPFHCALDSQGRLLIAEAFNHCVRRIDLKKGIITTIAGCGRKGYSGDGGPATQATFNEIYAIAVGGQDDLYLVDRLNAVVRKVDGRTGNMTTVAGNGRKGYSGDGGPATEASMIEPNDCCLDGKGGLLIADVGDWRIRRLDLSTGRISTFAGKGRQKGKIDRRQIGDGGPVAKAIIVGARAVCVDGRGNTYICEREGNAVRQVDAQGIIRTIAGTGAKGYSGDSGPAKKATFFGPKAIRCDMQGNVYVMDTENNVVRRIDPRTGIITTVAKGLSRPHGCVVDADGNMYIADSSNHRVVKVRIP